jgi:hypothetical protein
LRLVHTCAMLIAIALSWPVGAAIAGDLTCAQLRPIGAMARAESIVDLEAARAPADEGYLAQRVLAARAFELEPHAATRAAALLAVLPRSEDEEQAFNSAEFTDCGADYETSQKALAGMQEQLPRDAARFAPWTRPRLAPSKEPRKYLSLGWCMRRADSSSNPALRGVPRPSSRRFRWRRSSSRW